MKSGRQKNVDTLFSHVIPLWGSKRDTRYIYYTNVLLYKYIFFIFLILISSRYFGADFKFQTQNPK